MASLDAVELGHQAVGAPGAGGEVQAASGGGASRPGLRRLLRERAALAAGALLLLLVASCAAAPAWETLAGRGPLENNLSGTIRAGEKRVDVVSPEGAPIGPQWGREYFLGADGNGRDTMVRLLYGGRNSLMIGIAAAAITAGLAVLLGLVAGYFGGWPDALFRWALDVIWAFPVVLLGVALGTALAIGGLQLGPLTLAGDSKMIPVLIIAVVYVPYVARPIRGEVLALRQREFVEAARAQGAGPLRTMFSEILPNLTSTIVVLFPIVAANAILLESALSFLGAGVRSPEPSWGNMIDDGVERIVSAPHQAIAPGLCLVAAVLALNVFGDGLRDVLDPRSAGRGRR